jgi:hypothetical protein
MAADLRILPTDQPFAALRLSRPGQGHRIKVWINDSLLAFL